MTEKRKRAPGAGRKPKGEFVGKTATVTTRIMPDTREALEEAARASNRSLSQELEFRLRASLRRPTKAQQRNEALGYAIMFVAEAIEKDTGRSWLEDPFTGLALRYAIDQLAFYFAPVSTEGSAEIPPGIEEGAAKMPSLFAEQYRKPAGFAAVTAHLIIAQIKSASRSPEVPHNEWNMPIFFTAHEAVLAQIGRDLGLGAKKNREK
jgi:hypothetical protein